MAIGVDDITELEDPTGMNPVNPTGRAFSIDVGAAAIPDRATFERLATEYRGVWSTKFVIIDIDTDRPALYFSNTTNEPRHNQILRTLALTWREAGFIRGSIASHEEVYRLTFVPRREHREALDALELVERVYALVAASMPVIDDDLAYWIRTDWLPEFQPVRESFKASRVNLVFFDDLFARASFLPLESRRGLWPVAGDGSR